MYTTNIRHSRWFWFGDDCAVLTDGVGGSIFSLLLVVSSLHFVLFSASDTFRVTDRKPITWYLECWYISTNTPAEESQNKQVSFFLVGWLFGEMEGCCTVNTVRVWRRSQSACCWTTMVNLSCCCSSFCRLVHRRVEIYESDDSFNLVFLVNLTMVTNDGETRRIEKKINCRC